VITELDDSHTSFNIPKHTSHVTGASDDLSVADEATATEITRVSAQLAPTSDAIGFSAVEVIDRANVIKATTCYKVSGWGISAGHDPA
jgi:hypothetical protein